MSTNIENLDINQLQALKEQADALIEKKQRAKVDDAYQELLDVANSVGLSLEELIEHGRKTKKSTVKRTVAPRYRNPKNSNETWTGRGKQPRWVVNALAEGKSIDDLLI
ncbi:H-NS histone family protein [Acinetobacter puyangensis]|uniref:Nucleoid protein H-NS n=1 Tax=Acinetobacter puyangensis TaxID=1096779 RepID=A0A240EEA9_9GAMM|nr:H-NS histone family protein [Acinetobacter puyangensis]SNX46265.1 nucleoid protein H-NS [Acinetobacter puyangensis]